MKPPKLPALQFEHVSDEGPEIVPARQSSQDQLPDRENFPASHWIHASRDGELREPASQFTQALVPEVLVTEPSGQDAQSISVSF